MTTLVYIYGPPAVGKLTVAQRLEEATGYKLFHNHLTVNALREVFEFRSPAFVEVSSRLRLVVPDTALTIDTAATSPGDAAAAIVALLPTR